MIPHCAGSPHVVALVPPPRVGAPWSRLSRQERRAAVVAAVAEGRSVSSLAADHDVVPGAHAWRTLRAMWATEAERQGRAPVLAAPTPAGPPPGPGVPIGDLGDGVCRWPLWGAGATPGPEVALYCGAAARPGRVYCPVCTIRSRRVSAPRLDYRSVPERRR